MNFLFETRCVPAECGRRRLRSRRRRRRRHRRWWPSDWQTSGVLRTGDWGTVIMATETDGGNNGNKEEAAYRIPLESRLRAVAPEEVNPELLIVAHGMHGCSAGEAVLFCNENAAPGLTHLFFWIAARGVFVRIERIWGLERGSHDSSKRHQQRRQERLERLRRSSAPGIQTAPMFMESHKL